MYGNFAGRDASRGMAKQSFDLGMSLMGATSCIASHSFHHSEMLTPIDQPLDKLEDLRPDEMYVDPLDMYTCPDLYSAKT
jgi:membrane-associated progesterone receptor component